MKKLINNAVIMLMSVALCCLASCSKSDPYALASNEDIAVIKGNFKTLLENADCNVGNNGIEPSAAINKLLKGDRELRKAFNTIAEIKGISWSDAILVIDPKLNVFISTELTNEKEFNKSLKSALDDNGEDCDIETEGEYTVYNFDREAKAFVKGKTAYFAVSQEKKVTVDFLENKISASQEAPLASWQKDALDKGNFLSAIVNMGVIYKWLKNQTGIDYTKLASFGQYYDPDQLKEAWLTASASFNGLKFSMEFTACANDGKPLEVKINNAIDTELLEYSVPGAQLVLAYAMPQNVDWQDLIERTFDTIGERYNSESVAEAAKILQMFDGSIVGSLKLAKDIDDMPDFVVAAQISAANARTLFEKLQVLMDEQSEIYKNLAVEYDDPDFLDYIWKYEYDGKNMTVTYDGNTYYGVIGENVTYFGNVAKAADADAPKNIFEGKAAAFYCDLPSTQRYGSVKFPFGFKSTAYSEGSSIKTEFELTDTDGKLLENIFDFVAGQM